MQDLNLEKYYDQDSGTVRSLQLFEVCWLASCSAHPRRRLQTGTTLIFVSRLFVLQWENGVQG